MKPSELAGIFIIFLIAIVIMLTVTTRSPEDADRIVMLKKTFIKITDIHIQKYSTVYGTFQYEGKEYRIFSNDGYYYKKYNLSKGDTITEDVMLYMFNTGDTVDVQVGAMDLKKYEVN